MPFIPALFPQFGETVAADRFVGVLRTEHHLFFVVGQAVRMVRQVAAPYADGVYFGYVLRRSHQRRHRSEGLAREVHVEARHDYPHPAVGQLPADLHQSLVEELRLVDAHDIASEVISRIFCAESTGVERIALASCETTSSSEYRTSMRGLKISTRRRANSARFRRRISSSVLPENIEPHITSIQPFWLAFSKNILLQLCFVSLFRTPAGRYSSTRVIRAPRALRRPSMSL